MTVIDDKFEILNLNLIQMIEALGAEQPYFSDVLLDFFDFEKTGFSFPNDFCLMFVEAAQHLKPNEIASSCMELSSVLIHQYGENKGRKYFKLFSWPIWLTQSLFEVMQNYSDGSKILIDKDRYNLICDITLRCRAEFIGVLNQVKEIEFHRYQQINTIYSISRQSVTKLDDAFLPALEDLIEYVDMSALTDAVEFLSCSNELYLKNDYWKIITDIGYFMKDFSTCLESLKGNTSN